MMNLCGFAGHQANIHTKNPEVIVCKLAIITSGDGKQRLHTFTRMDVVNNNHKKIRVILIHFPQVRGQRSGRTDIFLW